MAVAALALVAAGCGNMSGSLAGTNQMAARDMALSVADPSSGTTQELTDLGAFLFATGAAAGLGSAPWSLFHAGDFGLYFTEGIESGKFVWSPTANDYELTETRVITVGSISGSADIQGVDLLPILAPSKISSFKVADFTGYFDGFLACFAPDEPCDE